MKTYLTRSTIVVPLWLMVLWGQVQASQVVIEKKNAVVWSRNQVIKGSIGALTATTGTLYLNGSAMPLSVSADSKTFAVPVRLSDGINSLVAKVDSAGIPRYSDTLRLTLGYKIRPEIHAYAAVSDRSVTLHAAVLENPDSSRLAFSWVVDQNNPTRITIAGTSDSVASCLIPVHAPPGEYYFAVAVTAGKGDTVWARTMITVDTLHIKPFNIRTDHARWIDSAAIYEVSPYFFVRNGKFRDVQNKLPEIAAMGVNTIWLQPITQTTEPYQGYHVTDYFSVREDLGGEAEIRSLVDAAHKLGLRVLFDFVPNHTTIYHPYAQDAIKYGPASHYFDFYQRALDAGTAGCSVRTEGMMSFVYYFGYWVLVNLNYNNEEVQRMLVEAARCWVERMDIDGYRIDFHWAMTDRKPELAKRIRSALKRLKPEVLILAEDFADRAVTFDEKADVAFDWRSLGHGRWETLFNGGAATQDVSAIRASVTNNGIGATQGGKVMRFMENNDTPRFIQRGLERTRMAASIMFALDGIPLIYNGQEIGVPTHPYEGQPIFRADTSIVSLDPAGLVQHYTRLASFRKAHPSLNGARCQEFEIYPNDGTCAAFYRSGFKDSVFVIMNLGSSPMTSELYIPTTKINLNLSKTYYLTDLMNGQVFSSRRLEDFVILPVEIGAFSIRYLTLAETPLTITAAEDTRTPARGNEMPKGCVLSQNYPNPFNPTTEIIFQLPMASRVSLKVYNLLGQEVATLVDGMRQAGTHFARFDGRNLPSGVYWYRMTAGDFVRAKRMLLLK